VVMSVRRMLLSGSTANADGFAMSSGDGLDELVGRIVDTPSSVRLSVGCCLLEDEWRDREDILCLVSFVYIRRHGGRVNMAVLALMPTAIRGSGLVANFRAVAAIVSGAKRCIRQRQEDTIDKRTQASLDDCGERKLGVVLYGIC